MDGEKIISGEAPADPEKRPGAAAQAHEVRPAESGGAQIGGSGAGCDSSVPKGIAHLPKIKKLFWWL